MINIPKNVCTVVTTVQDLISKMYPDIAHIHDKPVERLCVRAIFTPKNDQAISHIISLFCVWAHLLCFAKFETT